MMLFLLAFVSSCVRDLSSLCSLLAFGLVIFESLLNTNYKDFCVLDELII